jgi:hypothetical protein
VAWTLGAALAASSGGCSFLFVVPPHREDGSFDRLCSESKGAPVADVILGTLYLSSGLVAMGSSNKTVQASGGFSMGFAGAFLGSGIRGFSWTSECTELKKQYDPSVGERLRPRLRPGDLVPPRMPPPLAPSAPRPSSPADAAPAPPDDASTGTVAPAPTVPAKPAVRQQVDTE